MARLQWQHIRVVVTWTYILLNGCGPTHLFSDIVLICCRYIHSEMLILANPINHTTSIHAVISSQIAFVGLRRAQW